MSGPTGAVQTRARAALEATLRDARVHRTAKSAILAAARRFNYHVLRGMADPAVRPDPVSFARASPWKITHDYVRDATLALLCRELLERNIAGSIAELGVFRGDFAVLMAGHLPGRRIHLFDTFDGFADAEVEEDRAIVDTFLDFSKTDPASVQARFDDPQQVELHVGRFPETTDGVEDTFAVVSIDADLYSPVLSGLRWFYPRLSPGGVILVHDYNNAAFGGAKKAVHEFQADTGATLVPLPDWGGTAVITKSDESVRRPTAAHE